MNFIKKYSALIIPAAILVVAVLFILLAFLINSGVKKEMDESVSLAKNVSNQLKKTPSKDQAELMKKYQLKHKADADRISNMLLESTLRELVSYKVFPEPRDTSRQIFKDFGSDYRNAIQELVKKINASDAPSKQEIDMAQSVVSRDRRSSARGEIDPIVDAICKKRAQQASVYANPDLFAWYQLWDDYNFIGQADAIRDCWYSQVAYWIYSDVVDTIKILNEGSSKVSDSAVKRLFGVSFQKEADGAASSRGSGREGNGGLDMPVYITEELTPILGADAWTNRICNEKIDVVHFSVSVVLSAEKVADFMKELCSEKEHVFLGWDGMQEARELKHNQITILSSKVVPVIPDDNDNLYYRYGSGAVVQWTGTCEYVFVNDAYDAIKPESIKELLGSNDNRSSRNTKRKRR